MNGTVRNLGRLLVVAAVAALLAFGLGAGPAGAAPRSETVKRANQLIDICFGQGGEPTVFMDQSGDRIVVLCTYPDGTGDYCDAATGICTHPDTVPAAALPTIRVSTGALPKAQPVAVRPGTHLALSGGLVVLAADAR